MVLIKLDHGRIRNGTAYIIDINKHKIKYSTVYDGIIMLNKTTKTGGGMNGISFNFIVVARIRKRHPVVIRHIKIG
jgi:hypothetical protein